MYEKNGGLIVNGYLMTGVDDLNFQSLDLQYYSGGGWKGLATAFKVYEQANINNATTLTCQNRFGAPGFLGIWENLPSGTITYRATFQTPDGVDVYGFAKRVVTAGDGHYYPSYHFDQNISNAGIYRVDTNYTTWKAVS